MSESYFYSWLILGFSKDEAYFYQIQLNLERWFLNLDIYHIIRLLYNFISQCHPIFNKCLSPTSLNILRLLYMLFFFNFSLQTLSLPMNFSQCEVDLDLHSSPTLVLLSFLLLCFLLSCHTNLSFLVHL